jgi:hypothetical protein
MDAELHRIERYASKEVAEILRKMNVIFQHERVFALRLRDQTPSSGMTQKATGFPGAEMAPAWIGPVWVMLCLNLCTVYCGDTQIFKFVSSQLLLHPMKSVNIFIQVYNVNVQNALSPGVARENGLVYQSASTYDRFMSSLRMR